MFDRFFMQILDMSKTASIVILIVLVVRLLLKKAPKAFSYALWAIVLFRLLCPIAIETQLSIVPELPATSNGYTLADEPIDFAGAGVAAYQAVGDALNGGLGIQHVATTDKSDDGMTRYVSTDWWSVWILFGKYVWVAGIAVMLSYSVISYYTIRKKLEIVVPLRDNIYIADDIKSPFVIGFLKPKIYLPCNLGEKEQEYIILHEQHHIRRFDHIFKALAFLALTIHWFNPLVWLAFVLAGKDMEMSCDEAVIRKAGEDVRADYSASLLTLATGHRIISGTPLAFGEGDPKGRIRNLSKWRKPVILTIVIGIIVCLLAGVMLLTNPVEGAGEGSGVTYYAGTVVESVRIPFNEEGEEQRPYIVLQCDDGERRRFWIDGYDRISADLLDRYVIVRGKIESGTGQLVATNISISEKEFTETLEEAINHAILEHNYSPRYEGMMQVASFVQLSSGTEGLASTESDMKLIEKATVYGLAYHQVFRLEDGILVEEGGSHIPVMLTFSYDASKGFTLTEYWEPRDGSYYTKDIKAKFNGRPYPDTQKYILQQSLENYLQAMEYYQVGTDTLIRTVLESVRAKAQFTLLDNLLESDDSDAQILLQYGNDTLEYCFSQFLEGGQDGETADVMEAVCKKIISDRGEPLLLIDSDPPQTPQEWFDFYLKQALKLPYKYSEDEILTEYPGSYILLSLVGKVSVQLDWGISLYAENVTPSGLSIVCSRSGGSPTGELHSGSWFAIEKLDGDKWIRVEPTTDDLAWTEEAWLIPMNGNVIWKENWEFSYGTLPSGQYRIVKEIFDFRQTGDYDTALYYAEFEIS